MPGQNGFQLTRAITRDPRFADVPVIMCTSKNQETDKVWGMRQGARDYVVKPVDADELIAKIKALRLKQRHRRPWPTRKPCANCKAGWPSACRPRARSRAASPGWRSSARGHGLLLPLEQAGEIFPLAPLMPVPHTQAVVRRRGQPARRPARRGRPGALPRPAPRAAAEPAREQARLVAFERVAGPELRAAGRPPGRPAQRRAAARPSPSRRDGAPRPAFAGARWRDARRPRRGRRSISPRSRATSSSCRIVALSRTPSRLPTGDDMSFLDKFKTKRPQGRAATSRTTTTCGSTFDEVPAATNGRRRRRRRARARCARHERRDAHVPSLTERLARSSPRPRRPRLAGDFSETRLHGCDAAELARAAPACR